VVVSKRGAKFRAYCREGNCPGGLRVVAAIRRPWYTAAQAVAGEADFGSFKYQVRTGRGSVGKPKVGGREATED